MVVYKVVKTYFVEARNVDDAIWQIASKCLCCTANIIAAEPATQEELDGQAEADRLSEEAERRFKEEEGEGEA